MAYTTIDNPELYFQTKTYTGTGSSHAITLDGSEDMQPDWVWIKRRNSAGGNMTTDVIRGVTKTLITNENGAEQTFSNGLTAFGSDGFTVGSEDGFNKASDTFVAWNWKAGGSASSNSNGSITSSVSASTDAGFSISTFTSPGSGTFTFGHGLSSAPKVVILKRRDGSQNWIVGHDSAGWGYWLKLNDTDAKLSNTSMWQNTAPSSSIVSLDTSQIGTSNTFVAYCFAEKQGYSKFGSYTGTSSQVFIYTGFKPKFILIKKSSEGASWHLFDTSRTVSNGGNQLNKILFPNSSNAESDDAYNYVDAVSNGFRCFSGPSGQGTETNKNGHTFIYIAFSESSFVNSNGIPNNAR